MRALRKLRRHVARARGYWRTGAWLWRDYASVVRWRLLRVVLAGGAHIAAKFAAMGVIYFCIRSLTEGTPIVVPGLAVLAPQSREFVLFGVGGGVGLLILAAWFRYEVRRRAIRLGRRYEEHCARRIVVLASRLPDRRAPLASRIAAGDGMHSYMGYARYCGLAVRQLTSLLPTVASFATVALVLLWLDPALTLLLTVLAAAAALAQYPANHQTARASHLWERTRRAAARRFLTLFRRLSQYPLPLAADSPVLDGPFRDPTVRANIESFAGRATAAEQAGLVSRIGSSVLLGITLILLGIDIVEGGRSWAEVAVYLAAVRFALSDFVSVSKIASNLTRYHAQIDHYRDFVQDAAAAEAATDQPPGWPLCLRLAALDGSAGELRLEKGDVAALVLPGQLRHALAALFEPHGAPRGQPPLLVGDAMLAPEADLRTNLGLPASIDEAALARALEAFAPETAGPGLAPGWLDRGPASLWLRQLPEWALLALRVIAVRERGLALVAVEATRFGRMDKTWRAACRQALAKQVLVLVHHRPRGVGRHGERVAILADERGLRGWLPLAGRHSAAALTEVHARLGTQTAAEPLVEDMLE